MTRERLALVEDDRDLATSLTMALEKDGFDVKVYAPGRQGLEGILGNPPDLIPSTLTCRTSTASASAGRSVRHRRWPTCRSSSSPHG